MDSRYIVISDKYMQDGDYNYMTECTIKGKILQKTK